jgi:predicted RNA binding protein YcfA (HicA-like mRNA interferase family)
MAKLPFLSGYKIIKILSEFGFRQVHRKGSHVVLERTTPFGQIHCTVPLYPEIDRWLLLKILKQANIEKEEFLKKI